jgi:class 3 adenylate cyclase
MNWNELFNPSEDFEQTSAELIHQSPPNMELVPDQKKSQTMNIADYLVAFTTQSHSYCVGCVDMVNSTKISASLPSDKLSIYYETFLNSMAKIIGNFNGKVIKNIGDCLLYYFPLTENCSDLDKVSKCLDCGITMIKVQQMISQELVSNGLPGISYRVSADYGNVVIMNTNNSKEIDMIGPPVNMCLKINHSAKSNEFVIGGDFYEVIKKLQKYKFKQVTEYDVGFKLGYPVYKVQSKQLSYGL